MRIESKHKVCVGDLVIGGPKPLICIPLIGNSPSLVLDQAKAIAELQPDLIEWRVDALAGLADTDDWLGVLGDIRSCCPSIPLIFTCRSHLEGGLQELNPERRQTLIEKAISSDLVDIVDVEMCNSADFIEAVRLSAKDSECRLILSHHNFTSTPPESFIVDQLVMAETLGADIGKIAVMPTSYADVLTLLKASLQARSGPVSIPQVTISMGEAGVVSRVAGGLFGCDITFAVGSEASAPGQIPIKELRQSMELFFKAHPEG